MDDHLTSLRTSVKTAELWMTSSIFGRGLRCVIATLPLLAVAKLRAPGAVWP